MPTQPIQAEENRPVTQREIINHFYTHKIETFAIMGGTLYTTDAREWEDTSAWTLTDLLNYSKIDP